MLIKRHKPVESPPEEVPHPYRFVSVTSHAIDRASTRCLEHWQETRDFHEGISSWLRRVARDVLKDGVAFGWRGVAHVTWGNRVKLVFQKDRGGVALVTVYDVNEDAND